MKQSNPNIKLWEDQYKAHKWTIKKNLELKSSIEKLIQINDKLITLNTTLTKDREILLIEVGRLNNIIKEKEQNDKRGD